MAEYASAAGFIQFDVKEREANGQTVLDAVIKTLGTDGVLIRVTVWPELQTEPIAKGDFLAVDGKFTVGSYTDQSGQARQSLQISASSMAVLPGVKRGEREVVNSQNADTEPLF